MESASVWGSVWLLVIIDRMPLQVVQFMQGVRTVDPGLRQIRSQFYDSLGNLHALLPLFGFGINLPANFQNIWVSPVLRRDLLQFLVCFEVVAQPDPASGC
jgi:hypothetical protein